MSGSSERTCRSTSSARRKASCRGVDSPTTSSSLPHAPIRVLLMACHEENRWNYDEHWRSIAGDACRAGGEC